jgi:hypothetical protein
MFSKKEHDALITRNRGMILGDTITQLTSSISKSSDDTGQQ